METVQVLSKKKKIFFYIIMFCIPVVFFALAYLSYTFYKGVRLYDYIKTNQRGWRGHVHRADAELGFAPVPNSRGAHVFPVGPDIPMRYDQDGFRAPVGDAPVFSPKPLVLALGCSFTYGDGVRAEDTYPHLIAASLNGTEKNAGVCSYGLAQMLILAKKLIPIHKPDYLLVQYSTWLVDRAQAAFAPSYYGKTPVPFFYETGQGFTLHPPVFPAKVFDLPSDKYRGSTSGWTEALSFYWNVSLPLSLHDDMHMLEYLLNRGIGKIPNSKSSKDALIRNVYEEIAKVAKENRAKMIIVIMGSDWKPVTVDSGWFPAGAIVVNAHEALLDNLLVPDRAAYVMEYSIWRGDPPRVVDDHPNELAHRIIAESIVSEIKKADSRVYTSSQTHAPDQR